MAALIRLLPLALACAATPASAALTPRNLAGAIARPAPGTMLPAALVFTDQHGSGTTLGEIAAGRPLVLLFADYTCRHVCGPGATLTAAALHDSGLAANRDYAFAVVGLDPRDGLADARAFSVRIAAPDVARAVRLLVGSPQAVAAATRALGYGTAYDADGDQFAHDASLYVFDRDGRLVTLLPELGAQPAALRAAVANGRAAPSLGDRIARICYGLAEAHGRFSATVVTALQAAAVLTLAAVAAFLWKRRARA